MYFRGRLTARTVVDFYKEEHCMDRPCWMEGEASLSSLTCFLSIFLQIFVVAKLCKMKRKYAVLV